MHIENITCYFEVILADIYSFILKQQVLQKFRKKLCILAANAKSIKDYYNFGRIICVIRYSWNLLCNKDIIIYLILNYMSSNLFITWPINLLLQIIRNHLSYVCFIINITLMNKLQWGTFIVVTSDKRMGKMIWFMAR